MDDLFSTIVSSNLKMGSITRIIGQRLSSYIETDARKQRLLIILLLIDSNKIERMESMISIIEKYERELM